MASSVEISQQRGVTFVELAIIFGVFVMILLSLRNCGRDLKKSENLLSCAAYIMEQLAPPPDDQSLATATINAWVAGASNKEL